MPDLDDHSACPLARSATLRGALDQLLSREWLITNGRGGYASGTVIGAATRRYHGLLCAARHPPLERFMLLATTLDRVTVAGVPTEFSTYEFNHAFYPEGYRRLTDLTYRIDGPQPWVAFTYDLRPEVAPQAAATVVKRIVTVSGEDRVMLQYEVRPTNPSAEVRLEISPMLAMRDFHFLRRQSAVEPWDMVVEQSSLFVRDRLEPDVTLLLTARPHDGAAVRYEHAPLWWFNFRYREELARGFPGGEDLLKSGAFIAEGQGALRFEIEAAAFTPEPARAGRVDSRRQVSAVKAHDGAPQTSAAADAGQRLSAAAEQFVVARQRSDPAAPGRQTTILAGYHWFGDWGRDAFIALEGLLLLRRRFDEARQVLLTFAGAQRDGLIPNRFSDYGEESEYNSVDASLWFIHAVDAYIVASGDERIWSSSLAEPCRNVVEAFLKGTRYNIHADADGLISCGDPSTQITWMDAKVGDYVCTPRHGRPVEVNALWYHVLCILGRRCQPPDARRYQQLAARVAAVFADRFWNEHEQCLCDVVRDDEQDCAVRPNQLFAVSLPDSPLTERQAGAVFEAVTRHLLTPVGLRSLSNADSRYVRHYVGNGFERDRAYHNGTVWAWLMGAYIDAHLRVQGTSSESRRQGLALLQPLIDHLDEAGLGSISEIFDGDAPHTPRGCIAQAWSVAEVLRAYHRLMIEPAR